MPQIENPSIGEEITWTSEDGLEYRELIRQEYANFAFSAGEVLNHPVDTFYIMWDKDNAEGGLLLRPDEVAALAWICAGLLWSYHLAEVGDDK